MRDSSAFRPVQRYLHWTTFWLVLAAYALINIHIWTPRGILWHGLSEHLHMLVGVLVLLLTAPRLWLRSRHASPPVHPPLARATRIVAHVTHGLLYAFLIVQPLLGLAYRQLAGKDVSILGTTIIPSFVSHPNQPLAKELFLQYHIALGITFYFVIALHIAAALWHHWAVGDDVLKRMLKSRG